VPATERPQPRIIVLANQKGGVGKTTTAINLGTALATKRKVLIIDLDPQGNASTGLGVPRQDRGAGSYALLTGEKRLAELLRPTRIPNLTLLPADPELAGAEIELVGLENRERRLRDALANEAEALAGIEVILIDCPPSLGLLTLNALVAAQSVLVPLQTEFFALEGVSQITRTVERVKRALNPALELEGIVLTMFDRRNNLSELVAADVRAFFGDKVYATVIPRNVRISEAPSHGLPVILYDHRSAGAQAYVDLAAELLKRERRARKPAA
jgi:chromosome partitioning protein